MIARYTSRCTSCHGTINRGDVIVYDRRRRVSAHADCAPHNVVTFRTSGGTFYRNARGRCEDAPCCGCCTI